MRCNTLIRATFTFTHLPDTAPLRHPLDIWSLRPKEGRDDVTGVVPVSDSDVWRGCGLKGPGRMSISGVRTEARGMSPGLG